MLTALDRQTTSTKPTPGHIHKCTLAAVETHGFRRNARPPPHATGCLSTTKLIKANTKRLKYATESKHLALDRSLGVRCEFTALAASNSKRTCLREDKATLLVDRQSAAVCLGEGGRSATAGAERDGSGLSQSSGIRTASRGSLGKGGAVSLHVGTQQRKAV